MHVWNELPNWLQGVAITSLYGTILAALFVLLMPLLRRHVPARWRFALWLLVLVRFVPLPLPESRLSLFNLLPHGEANAESRDAAQHLAAERSPVSEVRSIETPSAAITSAVDMPAAGAIAEKSESHAAASAAERAVPADGLARFQQASRSWPLATTLVYLGGAALVLLRFAVASFSLRRLLRSSKVVTEGAALALLGETRTTMGIRHKVRLLLCDAMGTPAVAGYFRPALLISSATLAKLSPDELRLVFMHECAHIRRRDVLLNYAFVLLGALHWFNPVIWFVLPRIRAERELACDELVLSHAVDAAAYGQTLLDLFESAPRTRWPVAVGILEDNTTFAGRIHMIASYRQSSRRHLVSLGLLTAVIAACALTAPLSQAASPAPARGRGAPATAPGATALPPTAPSTDKNDNQAVGLDTPIREIVADQQPLERLLNYVRDTSGSNMVVNWNALQSLGLDRKTPVSINLRDVPLRKALQSLLDLAGGSANKLGFDMEDGVITISTAADIAAMKDRAAAPAASATHVAALGDMYKVKVYELITPGQIYTDELRVNEKGSLRLTNLGDVPAKGLTPMQIADKIAELAVSKGFLLPKGNGNPGPSVDVMWIPAAVPTALTFAPGAAALKAERKVSAGQFSHDVRDIIGAPATQTGALTADQRAAAQDLVDAVKQLVSRDMTVITVNGVLIVDGADEESLTRVVSLLEKLEQEQRQIRERAQDLRRLNPPGGDPPSPAK